MLLLRATNLLVTLLFFFFSFPTVELGMFDQCGFDCFSKLGAGKFIGSEILILAIKNQYELSFDTMRLARAQLQILDTIKLILQEKLNLGHSGD